MRSLRQNNQCDLSYDADYPKANTDESKNHSNFGHSFTRLVHATGCHLFEITGTHDCGQNCKDTATE